MKTIALAVALAIMQLNAFAQEKPAVSTVADAPSDLPAWKKLATEAYAGKQDDIFFVNDKVGWYGNGAGKVFHTTDGGTTTELASSWDDERGWSIERLAAKSRVAVGSLSRMENGRGGGNSRTIEKVADALKISVAELYRGLEAPPQAAALLEPEPRGAQV